LIQRRLLRFDERRTKQWPHKQHQYRSKCFIGLTQQQNKILPIILNVWRPLFCLLDFDQTVPINFALDEPGPS
jgi:hypothetical protein